MWGSGGLGAVSFGFTETLIGLAILVVVVVLLWKLVKFVWAAFSG
jgi:hypothetical protein